MELVLAVVAEVLATLWWRVQRSVLARERKVVGRLRGAAI